MPLPKDRKKKRQIEHLYLGENIYIFCEGKQTEPLYFQGFEKAIKSNPIYKNIIHIHIEGVGAETLRVIDYAEDFVKENKLKDAQIWCVYDKDSFPTQDFNAVSQKAEILNKEPSKVTYHCAWSNQCIEYWFILNFANYTSNNDRKEYRKFLHNKFKELGWNRYEKNNTELFDIMTEKGNPKNAILFAQRQLEAFKGKTDAQSAPATRVHLLVKELAKYLPESIGKKYI